MVGSARAKVSAQRRAASRTWARLGHSKTAEFNDLTGMCNRLSALQPTVMLSRRSRRMAVGIPCRYEVRIQNASALQQLRGIPDCIRQLFQEPPHDVTPALTGQPKVQRF